LANYTALYDACVLYPAPLRDFLIELATANLFRAKWTNRIHDEWIRNLLANRGDLTPGQLARTRLLMDKAVPDCQVSGYEHLIPSIDLPDADDRHVVAAAIHSRADAIITFNLKDFPASEIAKHNLEAIHPDEFINYQFDLNDAAVVVAAKNCCRRLKNPPKTGKDYLETLAAQGLFKTAAVLKDYESVLSAK